MRLNRLLPLPLMMLALTGCGSGTPEIIGVTHTLYLNGDGEPQVVTPIERIKEKEGKSYSRYEVMNSRIYSLEISPVWRGSKQAVFKGNVATFSVSDYWTITFDEEASKANPIYNISFEYPKDTEIDDLTLKYQVGDFSDHIILKLIPYSVVA